MINYIKELTLYCIETSEPVFSNCPNDISVPTDPGAATKTVTWTVPTATDFEGKKATVTVNPAGSLPPVLLNIGKRTIEYTATDVHSRTANCRFSIEVKGSFLKESRLFFFSLTSE